jgi:coenzyme F420 hydrogenase subunit beta
MDIKQVINKGLCLGCGVCAYDTEIETMDYSRRKGIYYPVLKHNKKYPVASSICPGKGYNIIHDSGTFYKGSNYSLELGYIDNLYASHSNSSEILRNSSSGGVMPEILIFLLSEGIVDKVAVTKFVYSRKGPRTVTLLTSDVQEIFNSQGSKYCPVDISDFIRMISGFKGKVAYVGTPCQIAGIREIQKIDKEIKEKVVLTIANFCGGFRSYNEIRRISGRHNVDFENISFLRYRGGGQPGSMLIKDKNGNHFEVNYPKYVGFTGYSKMLRCHFCVDATGELADIACGDAWLDKYQGDIFPWSIIITRDKRASLIIKSITDSGKIEIQPVSHDEVCLSQKQNLESKKIRQQSRYKLYKLLGYSLPKFDGGYYTIPTSLRVELVVFLFHRTKLIIENLGLYKYFRLLFKKDV